MIGTNIGNYAVTATIGEGGMGVVYVAEHAMLGRRAAVKVLHPELSTDRDIVARFFNEARALTAIRHPSIVEIFDFGYLPDASAYIVMEYLEGESLGARCRRLRKLDVRQALLLVRQIAGALGAAHERGVVHRDLKPDNVFLVPDPEVAGGERIKVLDFGIAKLGTPGDRSRTQTGSVLGTPTYMSPEQCRGAGSVDARADLYALGCVLYEMLCGRPPFINEGIGDLIAHHLYFAPPAPRSLDPALPDAVDQLVMWLLQKEPAARPQTARDVIDAVDRAAAAVPAPPAPVHTPVTLKRSSAARTPPTGVPAPTQITTLTSAAAMSSRVLPKQPLARRRWVIAVVAGSLIALGAVVVIALGAAAPPSPSPAAAAPAAVVPVAAPAPSVAPVARPAEPPAAPPEPTRPVDTPPRAVERIVLAIDSVPPGASLIVDGHSIGTTPFGDSIVPATGQRVYTVQKAGYEPATVSLPTDRAGTQLVTLKKKKVVRPARGSDSVGDKGVNPFD